MQYVLYADNASRHLANGLVHSLFSRHAFACGSYLKAVRELTKTRYEKLSMERWRNQNPAMAMVCDKFQSDVTKAVEEKFW